MADLDEKLNSALNLMRRMPPSSTENSLAGLLELAPELTDELLTHVDQPLKVAMDKEAKKNYVLCDYNRDGDSYRSPWSNKYYPEIEEDGFKPNDQLRELEIKANKLFEIYRKLYFNSGYSSAYFFETDEKDEQGFGACWLINKEVGMQGNLRKGSWDSIHVFEVVSTGKKNEFTYKLTTTVMITLILSSDPLGTCDLSGLRTQQIEQTCPAKDQDAHVKTMGQMLEDCETRIRNAIEKIYIQKTRTVITGIRGDGSAKEKQWGDIAASLKTAKFHKDKQT